MIEIVVIILIIAISFDTTLFLQSQISQPIFSCILIGLIVDNIQMGIYIGAISQLIASSYIPVGGSNIPDMQISVILLDDLLPCPKTRTNHIYTFLY